MLILTFRGWKRLFFELKLPAPSSCDGYSGQFTLFQTIINKTYTKIISVTSAFLIKEWTATQYVSHKLLVPYIGYKGKKKNLHPWNHILVYNWFLWQYNIYLSWKWNPLDYGFCFCCMKQSTQLASIALYDKASIYTIALYVMPTSQHLYNLIPSFWRKIKLKLIFQAKETLGQCSDSLWTEEMVTRKVDSGVGEKRTKHANIFPLLAQWCEVPSMATAIH